MGALAKRPDDGPGGRAPAKKAAKKAVKKAAKKALAKKAATAPAKKVAKKAVKKAPAKAAKKVPAKVAKKAAKKSPPTKGATKTSASRGASMGLPELPAAPTDPFEILGLRGPLTTSTLKRAWREYAARHHPDQGGDPATFSRGRGAFEALRDQVDAT